MTAGPSDPAAPTQSAVYSGASSVSELPLTSGIPAPSTTIGAGPTPAASQTDAAASAPMTGAAMPMRTGAIGAAALFAGAGMVWNM